MALELTVASLPTNSLAFSNRVFVSSANIARFPNSKVKIGPMVYDVVGRDDVTNMDVCMNSLQRTSCRVTQGQTVAVEPLRTSIPPAYSIRLDVDTLGRRPVNMKEEDIITHFKSVFSGQVMVQEMVLCSDKEGTPLKYIVKAIEVIKLSNTTSSTTSSSPNQPTNTAQEGKVSEPIEYAQYGTVTEDTSIECDALQGHGATRLVTVEKSESKKRPAILNPNWKFEDMGIGGLDTEFSAIFRRAFASRLFPPKVIQQLGIKHVKG